MIDPRRISFIIPTLGQNSNLLIHNIESIRTFSKYSEILVVTCAENDELIHLLNNYEARYIYCEKNGVFNALNKGISCLGPEIKYFVFLGDDDCIVPENFKAMTNQDKIEKLDIIFGSVIVKNEQGQRIYTNRSTRFAHKLLLLTPNFIPLPGTLINKNLCKELGSFSEKYHLASDLDFWLKIRKVASFKKYKKVVAEFRLSEKTLTGRLRDVSIRESSEIRNNHVRKCKGVYRVYEKGMTKVTEKVYRHVSK